MSKEAQPWFAPTGENFVAKNGLFFLQKSMSQALYLREFSETYDDKVIILRLEEQPNSQGHASEKKQCEKFSKWLEMQQKQERVEYSKF